MHTAIGKCGKKIHQNTEWFSLGTGTSRLFLKKVFCIFPHTTFYGQRGKKKTVQKKSTLHCVRPVEENAGNCEKECFIGSLPKASGCALGGPKDIKQRKSQIWALNGAGTASPSLETPSRGPSPAESDLRAPSCPPPSFPVPSLRMQTLLLDLPWARELTQSIPCFFFFFFWLF